MLNKAILIGRLVRDPELRYTPGGVAVGNFTLAVDRSFTNAQGEKETDFIDCVVWRKLAETVSQHLGQGRLVAVDGRLQIRSYDDRNGVRRKAAEVVANDVRFLDWPDDAKKGEDAPAGRADDSGDFDFTDDDVPF